MYTIWPQESKELDLLSCNQVSSAYLQGSLPYETIYKLQIIYIDLADNIIQRKQGGSYYLAKQDD
jgi:hypothetical protein